MTPLSRRSGHRGARGVAALDTPPACSWCDCEQAEAVLSIENDEQTSVLVLGPACLRQLTAMGLGIQARAMEARHG